MRYWLNFCFLFFFFTIFSQEKYAKEISFITENDLYVSTKKDRYYTNGVFLKYRYLSNTKKDNQEKRILEWQIGHEMYSPYKAIVQNIDEHDRPFASYLFGEFGVNRVYKNHTILNTSLQIGVIGPDAFGKELQDFIHDIYGFRKAIGWEFQIKNALGLNLNAEYTKFLVKDSSNYYDLTWINDAKFGTIYTNISSGFYARIGFKPLASILNSMAFNTNLNNDTTNFTRELESFFYLKPTLKYSFYDATIQGSFLNTSSAVTKELVPLVFHIEAGLNFTSNRCTFGYVFHFSSNSSQQLRYVNGNIYGTVFINYSMH